MPTVHIVNYAGHDYTPAKEFGELRYVTKGYVSQGHLDRVLFEVVDGLKNSSPGDWLLPSGLLLLNILAAGAWYERHGSLRILAWDQKERTYRPMQVSQDQIADLFKNLTNDERTSTKAS